MITDDTTSCIGCPNYYAESEWFGHKLCFRCLQRMYIIIEQFAIKIEITIL